MNPELLDISQREAIRKDEEVRRKDLTKKRKKYQCNKCEKFETEDYDQLLLHKLTCIGRSSL